MIIDIVMPGVDGLKLIRGLKEARRSVKPKILALSGLINGIGSAAMAAGADAFFRKRTGMEEMIGALTEYLPALRETDLIEKLREA